jgi:hypothetical protein
LFNDRPRRREAATGTDAGFHQGHGFTISRDVVTTPPFVTDRLRHPMRNLRFAVDRAAVMFSVNADVVELLIHANNETSVELFILDGNSHLANDLSRRSCRNWT